MDLKNPNLDEQVAAIESLGSDIEARVRMHVERARAEVQEAQRALQTIDGAGIVGAAAHCWVRELDFSGINTTYQSVRARIEINNHLGCYDGIVNTSSDRGDPIVQPGRYRAVLCLIPIKDES